MVPWPECGFVMTGIIEGGRDGDSQGCRGLSGSSTFFYSNLWDHCRELKRDYGGTNHDMEIFGKDRLAQSINAREIKTDVIFFFFFVPLTFTQEQTGTLF